MLNVAIAAQVQDNSQFLERYSDFLPQERDSTCWRRSIVVLFYALCHNNGTVGVVLVIAQSIRLCRASSHRKVHCQHPHPVCPHRAHDVASDQQLLERWFQDRSEAGTDRVAKYQHEVSHHFQTVLGSVGNARGFCLHGLPRAREREQ